MCRTKNISAVAMLLMAALPVFFMLMVAGETFGGTIPIPVGQESFYYGAVADPVESADPFLVKPVGIGPAATGGNSVSLQVHIQQFSAPFDIYMAHVSPADPGQILILQPDLSSRSFAADEIVQAFSSGHLPDGAGPWKSNIAGPVEEALFGDIPVSSLPPGEHVIYLLATPHGSLNDYYLWSTSVNILNSRPGDESPFGFNPASVVKQGYNNNGFGDASDIGVKWMRDAVYAYWFLVQPDLSKQTYDFSQYDGRWSKVPAGMNILANIAPQGPLDEGRCLTNSYFPVDEQKYTAFVKAVVQRYNSDSYATAGLASPIKYWQVGNEPNSLKSGFADLQRITYGAIKEVCPDCTVLIGGVPGMPPVANYIASFDQQYKPILDALGGKYVDVMDFHWYGNATGDYHGVKDAYNHIRGVLDAGGFPSLPFWITEMGAYSGDPLVSLASPVDYPLQTEQQQALDYFKRFVYPLSLGVKKIFPAFGLMEGFKHEGGYFDYTGLIYDGEGSGDLGLGVKKLGYYTYKKMTDMLEGSDWNSIRTIQAFDNIYIFMFTKNNAPLYVAWWDYFNEPSFAPGNKKTISITGVQGNSVLVTEAIPKFSAGRDVTDYATAFNTQNISTSNGTVTLILTENPVFVEVLK